MIFEKAMVEELATITKLSTKCYPLITPKGTLEPYLAYRKASIDHKLTLSGFLGKSTCEYEFAIVSKTYDELQELTEAVTDKIKSFLQRSIGTTSTILVESVTIMHRGDTYSVDAENYRADLYVQVKF